MTLRVNSLKSSRDAYLAALREAGIEARPALYTSHGVILSQPTEVLALPGFKEGHLSIQDAAAQLAAPLLDVQLEHRVLDACAAPGGKTAHILEICPALGRLAAVEKDPCRIIMLKDTLDRLRLEAQIINADACRPQDWWDGGLFDRILVDAPCSASGVIRRHPDIKLLKRETDMARLIGEQARLLEALWPLLTQGGKLLYVTCSVLPVENQDQIASFLHQHRDARPLIIDVPWGHTTGAGRQILPGEADMDGFFYAALVRDSQGL
jgi:16S rRNA (cytosine967-C5)-methyltransferase